VQGAGNPFQMRELHPEHCNVLEKANLTSTQAKNKSTTLHYMKQCITLTYSAKEVKKQKDNVKNREVYFCIGYSTCWPRPLHFVLKDLKGKHDLRWLRISMSYHRFPNMRDIFQSQLAAKMIEKSPPRSPEAIPLKTMGGVEIEWDIQKNGDHGEHRLSAANQSSLQFCTARSTHRIVLRARRLGQPNNLPVAIYERFPGRKRSSYFIKASVTSAFKALAMNYYGLQKGDVRLKYTPHSL
jgi:hypothetical protein